MVKTAGIQSFLATTVAPKLLGLASKPISAGMSKAIGASGGALIGGITGSAAADPGNKSKGFLAGAAAGGTVGFFGGKTLAGFGKGGVDSARITGFANELKNLGTQGLDTKGYLKGVGKYLGDSWADPSHLKEIGSEKILGPLHRPAAGISAKAPVATVAKEQGSGFTRGVGNLSRNVMGITDGSYGVKGSNMASRTIDVLGKEVQEARHYTKGDFKYKRSLLGQASSVALTTGAGIGALEFQGATNEDGSPASLPKKLYKGTTSALSWGVAPRIMGTKMVAYDIPKMFINPEG